MVASSLHPDEQKILDLLREVYEGYDVRIVHRSGVPLAKLGCRQGGGMAVNLPRMAEQYRGKSNEQIKAEMLTWPR